jgi:hypothetical protein
MQADLWFLASRHSCRRDPGSAAFVGLHVASREVVDPASLSGLSAAMAEQGLRPQQGEYGARRDEVATPDPQDGDRKLPALG